MPPASKENGVGGCKRCGDECGCAGGVKAGKCGTSCQAGGCQCAHRIDPDPEVCPPLMCCDFSTIAANRLCSLPVICVQTKFFVQ